MLGGGVGLVGAGGVLPLPSAALEDGSDDDVAGDGYGTIDLLLGPLEGAGGEGSGGGGGTDIARVEVVIPIAGEAGSATECKSAFVTAVASVMWLLLVRLIPDELASPPSEPAICMEGVGAPFVRLAGVAPTGLFILVFGRPLTPSIDDDIGLPGGTAEPLAPDVRPLIPALGSLLPADESKPCPAEPADDEFEKVPAPPLLLTALLCVLLFQPDGVIALLVSPRLLSARSFMNDCLLLDLVVLHPADRRMPTPNRPMKPARGLLPIGFSSPV